MAGLILSGAYEPPECNLKTSVVTIGKSLNSGHIGACAHVCCREAVSLSEVGLLATPQNFELVNSFNKEGCGLQEADSASINHL